MAPNSTPLPSNVRISVSAPGKVILHGEHSVVYDKLAFAASLGLRTRLEFSEAQTESGRASIDFPALNLLHFYTLQDIRSLLDKPLPLTKAPSYYNFAHPELVDHDQLLKTIEQFMVEKSGSQCLEPKQQQALTAFLYLFWCFLGSVDVELREFQLNLRSELTVSAGTGSSASFAVTVVAFLIQYIRLKKGKAKSPYKSFSLTNQDLGRFDKTELELISRWAFQSEKIIHGTPSGVDNTICTYGGLVEFRKGTTPKVVELSTKFRMVLVNTKVPRDTKRLVEIAAARRDKYKVIIDAILDTMDEVTVKALEIIKRINKRTGESSQLFQTLGELTDMNQNLLKCLGVSHPKLDEACLILARKGLHGKLTGAGGGGYAISLVPPDVDEGVVFQVVEELNSGGFQALLTDLGGCGVTVDSF